MLQHYAVIYIQKIFIYAYLWVCRIWLCFICEFRCDKPWKRTNNIPGYLLYLFECVLLATWSQNASEREAEDGIRTRWENNRACYNSSGSDRIFYLYCIIRLQSRPARIRLYISSLLTYRVERKNNHKHSVSRMRLSVHRLNLNSSAERKRNFEYSENDFSLLSLE